MEVKQDFTGKHLLEISGHMNEVEGKLFMKILKINAARELFEEMNCFLRKVCIKKSSFP